MGIKPYNFTAPIPGIKADNNRTTNNNYHMKTVTDLRRMQAYTPPFAEEFLVRVETGFLESEYTIPNIIEEEEDW